MVMGKDGVNIKNVKKPPGNKDEKQSAPLPISRKRQSELTNTYMSPQALNNNSSHNRLEYKVDQVKNASAFRNNDFRVLNKHSLTPNKMTVPPGTK